MHTDFFIAGKYVVSSGGERFADIEPATENQLALVAAADRADVDRAVCRGPRRRRQRTVAAHDRRAARQAAASPG